MTAPPFVRTKFRLDRCQDVDGAPEALVAEHPGSDAANLLGKMDRPPPEQKKLRITSFATHATRGILRDRQTRRQVMFWTMLVAVVMLFLGATFAPVLDAHV